MNETHQKSEFGLPIRSKPALILLVILDVVVFGYLLVTHFDRLLSSAIPLGVEVGLGLVLVVVGMIGLARREVFLRWEFRVLPPVRHPSRAWRVYYWWSHVLGMVFFCEVGGAFLIAAIIRVLTSQP